MVLSTASCDCSRSMCELLCGFHGQQAQIQQEVNSRRRDWVGVKVAFSAV